MSARSNWRAASSLDARGIRDHLTALVDAVPTVRSIVVAPDLGLVGGHCREAVGSVSTVVSKRATVDYEY